MVWDGQLSMATLAAATPGPPGVVATVSWWERSVQGSARPRHPGEWEPKRLAEGQAANETAGRAFVSRPLDWPASHCGTADRTAEYLAIGPLLDPPVAVDRTLVPALRAKVYTLAPGCLSR